MWQPLPVKVRERLCTENALLSKEREHASWDEFVEAIERYRDLADDYDGQGAIAPSSEVIDSAVAMMRDMIGVAIPNYSVPGPNGSVNLAWDLDDETSVTIEVIDVSRAEVILVDGDAGEHRVWTLNRIVEEVVG